MEPMAVDCCLFCGGWTTCRRRGTICWIKGMGVGERRSGTAAGKTMGRTRAAEGGRRRRWRAKFMAAGCGLVYNIRYELYLLYRKRGCGGAWP